METKLSIQKKAEYESSQSGTVLGRKIEVMIADTTIENLAIISNSLIEFIQHSIFYGLVEIDFKRDPSLTREMQW